MDEEKKEQEQTQDTTVEFDPISASVEDLTKRLTETTSEESPEEPQDDSDEEKTPEAPEKELQEAKESDSNESQKVKAKAEPKESVESETLKKQVRDKELMLQRQAYEIGQLRKVRDELEAKIKAKSEGLEQRFSETPDQAIDDKIEIRETQKEIGEVDRRIVRSRARALVETFVEPKEGLPEAMVECLQNDGIDQSYIKDFVTDPYNVASAGEIVQLAKRAEERMVAKNLYGMLQQALTKIKDLQKKPEALLDKVDQALRSGPAITGRSGRTANNGSVSGGTQLADMPLDSLYESLKQAQRQS